MPKFSLNEPVHQELFRQDLVLYVLRNSYIGTYLSIPVDLNKNLTHSSESKRYVKKYFFKYIVMAYLLLQYFSQGYIWRLRDLEEVEVTLKFCSVLLPTYTLF